MYMGAKTKKLQQEEEQRRKRIFEQAKSDNAKLITEVYARFQDNLAEFAKNHQNEINSNSKFRDRFSQMCQQFDVNPMLGFGDFYQHLAMKVLDICAKTRNSNGGIMLIDSILAAYHRREKNSITNTDVIRAVQQAYPLGNVSVIDKQYVCTIPIELGASLSVLLSIASKYGFISGKLLKKEKNWSSEQFQQQIDGLRKRGVIWVDKQTGGRPHYYFLSHIETDFRQFVAFMKEY